MEFNKNKSNILHLDVNSCFATIEQQANPLLRDKVVVVGSYPTDSGCILAASVSAKKKGIKTGMRIRDGKQIYPKLIVLPPDPPKYRFVHNKIKKLLTDYSPQVIPKSIDEFVFETVNGEPWTVSREIKDRIKKEIGEYITVSIGISTNKYLAKIASNLQKPDGLFEINKSNYREVFSGFKLTDLTGIKNGNSKRLKLVGIKTVLDFFESPLSKLKIAFNGINGYYWYLALRGYDVGKFDEIRGQKTYGNSYAPPPQFSNNIEKILSKLSQKTGERLRKAGKKAGGIHLGLLSRNGKYWHKSLKLKNDIFDGRDIYDKLNFLLKSSKIKNNLRNISISIFDLKDKDNLQFEIFSDIDRKNRLNKTIDKINSNFGSFTIYPARMINSQDIIKDRIAFGH
jgi:DNA polymerase-4